MDKLTKYLTEPFLIEEGINDPGILKAVFLAGGPGSGKGFVGSGLFGIPKKINVSAYGLKLVNQDKELVRMLKKYGFGTDLDDMPEELFRQLTDPDYEDYSGLRSRAKELTAARKKLYMDGRLGLIIDGTGHKYNKIKEQKMELEEIGYDCFMVFVHTDLEIAQQRNMERPRKLNPELVERSWRDVQRNREVFQGLFGNANFMMVNNSDTLSEKAATKKFNMLVKKGIGNFIRKPVKNFRGKKWIAKQKILDEKIKIDVNVGDTILTGRFKNKKVFVKNIGKDKYGMPTINGRPVVKFRMGRDKDFLKSVDEAPRVPRKKGQHRGSKSHSDLYTDENPKGTIKGLKFATVKDAKASVSKIRGSGKSHAHKIQAAVAMEQRAREMGKTSQAAVYRAYINKMKKKTKKKNEEFGAPAGMLPSPSRKMVKKMKKKGNTSVPYGSGYKKIQEFINKPKMKSALQKLVDKNLIPKIYTKNISKLQIYLTNNPVVMTQLLRLLGENINEQKQVKKVIGVFGGRFQPFHSGHLATYKWLSKRVDEAYITTSNIKQPPRHPMNFKEKVRHMVKMGIPKNRIIQEKTPYVAANLLKKFNPDTTAVVYAFGAKDAGRLKGGTKKGGGKTYYQDFIKNKNNLEGFDIHGYYLTAPQAGNVSGTQMRQLLGDPNVDEKERIKGFKKVFGYFDKGVYNMMTNKFRKLFESYDLSDELIEEFLLEATSTPNGNLDDGPSTFYTDYNTYKKTSKKWLDSIYKDAGWKVVDYVLSNDAKNSITKEYRSVPLTYLDHGQAAGSTSAVTKYKKWMDGVVKPLGWEVVSWMGTTAAINNIIGTLFAAGADEDSYEIESLFEKFNLDKEVKLITEGGAYGHLNHPFDDKNLTFSDFRKLIINTLQGKLDSEGAVTEKTDGQNIMVSWKNGKLIAARNKGHIKNYGANALDINGIKNMFAGRGEIEKAFVYAMRDLQKAVASLSDAQKNKIFDEGKKFMSLEVIYPKTANVIPYDKSLLQFHGTIEYDSAGSPIGEDRGSARMLAGMIKQVNQDIQKAFKIEKPFISQLPKVKDFSKRQNYFLGKLDKLQKEYNLKGSNTLADYHQAYWMEYIYNGAKQTDYKNPDNRILVKLVRRWAFFDKSYKVPQIRKDLKKYPKFLDWILSTDKMDHAKLQKKHIRDWEVLFFELGAEILSNLSDFIAANPKKAVQKIRQDLIKAISQVKKSKNPKVLNTLKTQLDRLNAIGGLKSVVPSEGITFVFKGKLYKYTGAFAPANQILGMLKFV